MNFATSPNAEASVFIDNQMFKIQSVLNTRINLFAQMANIGHHIARQLVKLQLSCQKFANILNVLLCAVSLCEILSFKHIALSFSEF